MTEVLVDPDTHEVSAEPVLLVAQLSGALALCLHDENRGVGGLLHLRFLDESGRPSDVTDATLSGILVILDRFKRAVLGSAAPHDGVHARILAHAPPPTDAAEPTASLVDLIQADLAEAKIACGSQITRRIEPVRVCFQPSEGRVWVARSDDPRPLKRSRARLG
jgi:chemotaxis receptor (MCP) glutamine deamidase CheD